MRLTTKNSLIFLAITILVFCLGAQVFFVQLHTIVDEEAFEELLQMKKDVVAYMEKNSSFPTTIDANTFLEFSETPMPVSERMLDTTYYVEKFGETLPFKTIVFNSVMNQKNYKVTLGEAVFERDDLMEAILTSLAILVTFLVAALLIFNYISAKILWRPFYRTLHQLSNYNIDRDGAIAYQKSGTTEFNIFSEAVSKMTAKLSADYQNLKSFTENAAHESQTPVAVMIAKTEGLLQCDNFTKEQKEEIYNLNQTAIKLKKLNQTLLLLSKIENNQFKVIRDTNVSERVKAKMEQFDDLFKIKNIMPALHIGENVHLTMDPVLVDAVISNLVGNALKYTSPGKDVLVTLDKHKFSVSNSGDNLNVDPEKLFERFFKLNQDSESSGLGLALVKQIANTHGHNITYTFQNNKHTFEYTF